eukprot:508201-Amorphochlora_amoeboformis.AAC.1
MRDQNVVLPGIPLRNPGILVILMLLFPNPGISTLPPRISTLNSRYGLSKSLRILLGEIESVSLSPRNYPGIPGLTTAGLEGWGKRGVSGRVRVGFGVGGWFVGFGGVLGGKGGFRKVLVVRLSV